MTERAHTAIDEGHGDRAVAACRAVVLDELRGVGQAGNGLGKRVAVRILQSVGEREREREREKERVCERTCVYALLCLSAARWCSVRRARPQPASCAYIVQPHLAYAHTHTHTHTHTHARDLSSLIMQQERSRKLSRKPAPRAAVVSLALCRCQVDEESPMHERRDPPEVLAAITSE
jgi:hypothetical protein